jgi:NAD(P)-dependent dehydrogenase (short-subunit alcohol dehydrogenase family)
VALFGGKLRQRPAGAFLRIYQGNNMNIVITGSTKGIGFGMAREFLRRGHNVVISSRGQQAVDDAVAQLSAEFPAEKISGQPCDVGSYDQAQELWNAGEQAFGGIDIWVNNAGRDGIQELLHEIPPEDYTLTITTNLTGLLHCNRVAIAGMRTQGNGKIFNMEGFGSDGSTMAKYVVYGATKYAVKYITKALVKECKDTPVQMCYLSPGMVVTDLLISPEARQEPDWERKRNIYNILADTTDTVCPWLVDGILNTTKNGDAVRWLTPRKVMGRFLMSRIKKRDILTPLGM